MMVHLERKPIRRKMNSQIGSTVSTPSAAKVNHPAWWGYQALGSDTLRQLPSDWLLLPSFDVAASWSRSATKQQNPLRF